MVHKSPFVFEIIGPAGSGKTTITQAILENRVSIKAETPPVIRSYKNIPFYVNNTIILAPILFQLFRSDKRVPSRNVFLTLNRLQGWAERLNRQVDTPIRAIVLDQGPVYMFSYLQLFGTQSIFSDGLQTWLDNLYQKWAHSLNLIIWLDATNHVLVDRVRGRVKNHGIKRFPDTRAFQYYEKRRNSFEKIISRLTLHNNHLEVLHLNTGERPVTEITEHIITVLENHGIK